MNLKESNQNRPQSYRGTIYYDGECPFCLAWVRRMRGILGKRGYLFLPLQSEGTAQRLHLTPSELLNEMRLLTEDEKLVSGGDAVVYLAREVWWAKPLYLLSYIPGVSRLVRSLYRSIARRRHCLGVTS